MKALTNREKTILKLLASGKSRKEIAKDTGISFNTANVHLNNIMRKLNIHKSVQLTLYCLKNNLGCAASHNTKRAGRPCRESMEGCSK